MMGNPVRVYKNHTLAGFFFYIGKKELQLTLCLLLGMHRKRRLKNGKQGERTTL